MGTLYALGLTYPPGNINTLLGTTVKTGGRPPRDQFFAAARTLDTLDGHQLDDGLPYVVWQFSVLQPYMVTNLFSICPGRSAEVFIRTPNEDDNFRYYKGVMTKPLNLSQLRDFNRYQNLELIIRRLEIVGQLDFQQAANSGNWFFF